MTLVDIILIAVIAAVVVLAASKIIRDRKSGKSCSCGCSGCSEKCSMKK